MLKLGKCVYTCVSIQWILNDKLASWIFYFYICRRNRDRKQELEMDWSDKKEANEIDAFCANLRNGHTSKQFFPGAAKFQEMWVTLLAVYTN